MKTIKTLILLLLLTSTLYTCKNANEIKKREKLKNATHHIIKVKTPDNLGIIKNINTTIFDNKINNKAGTLVDVRTSKDFTNGHIKGAVNIDFNNRTFVDDINVLDKNKPVLVYCGSGNRGGRATLIMQSLGFKEVYNLDHGLNSWFTEKKEIVTTENNNNKKLQKLLTQKEHKGKVLNGKLHQVNVEEFEKLIKENKVTLVDVRTAKEFASGHINGAINVDWKNRHFAKHISHVTNEKPIAVYCGSGNRGTRAMYAMTAIGFKEIYNLDKGIKSWNSANKALKTLQVKGDKHHLDVENFNNAILGGVGKLVDVRTSKEFEDSHIPHAINIDFKNNNFKTEFQKLDKEIPVLIYCRSGGRSSRATKALTKMGFKVYNLDKGINQWKSKHMKVKGKNVHKKDSSEEGC